MPCKAKKSSGPKASHNSKSVGRVRPCDEPGHEATCCEENEDSKTSYADQVEAPDMGPSEIVFRRAENSPSRIQFDEAFQFFVHMPIPIPKTIGCKGCR